MTTMVPVEEVIRLREELASVRKNYHDRANRLQGQLLISQATMIKAQATVKSMQKQIETLTQILNEQEGH